MTQLEPRIPIKADQKEGFFTTLDVLLVHNDGACWAASEFGGGVVSQDRGYPRLSTAPVKLTFIKVGFNPPPIANGDLIIITATEPLVVAKEKQVLGKFNSEAMYYAASDDDPKEGFYIYRVAGAGTVQYGDEIYLVNRNNNERVGRDGERIYLSTAASNGDTFFVLDPKTPPLVTSALPLDQLHNSGEQYNTTAHGWVWRKKEPLDQMAYVEATIPAGNFTVLAQFAPGGSEGFLAATIFVKAGETPLASQNVYTESYPANDWQRALVPFTMPSAGVVTVEILAANNDETLWTGAVSINPAGQRPFYVIAHRCNTVEDAVNAARQGANAIEFDIMATREDDGRITFLVDHSGPGGSTPFDEYMDGIVRERILDTVVLLQFDIKPNGDISSFDYGSALAKKTLDHSIPPNVCFFSVEDPAMADLFYQGVAAAGIPVGPRDASLIKNFPTQETDPSIWYDTATSEADATFLGLGVAAGAIISTMAEWIEPVSYTTNLRDRDQVLKKVYYWTLDSEDSMRKMLDLNVDGIIVNKPSTLIAVLGSQPYAQMFRLATINDSPNTVFGWPPPATATPKRPAAKRRAPRPAEEAAP